MYVCVIKKKNTVGKKGVTISWDSNIYLPLVSVFSMGDSLAAFWKAWDKAWCE